MLFTDVSAERAVRAYGTHRITIPNHKRLNQYTLKAIIKDAGLTDKQFKNLL